MREIIVKVQGSSDEPYTVIVVHTSDTLHMNCSCQAGQLNQICKHRLAILDGDLSAVVSGADQLNDLPTLLIGTEAHRMHAALRQSERALDQAKRDVTLAKRVIGRKLQIPGSEITFGS